MLRIVGASQANDVLDISPPLLHMTASLGRLFPDLEDAEGAPSCADAVLRGMLTRDVANAGEGVGLQLEH